MLGFSGGARGKEPACQCRRCKRCGFSLWVRKIPWRRAWQPIPIFLSVKLHEQRSLAGYSPWGCTESEMTETTEHICMPIYAKECQGLTSKRAFWGPTVGRKGRERWKKRERERERERERWREIKAKRERESAKEQTCRAGALCGNFD